MRNARKRKQLTASTMIGTTIPRLRSPSTRSKATNMVSAKINVVSREKRATAQASTVTAVLRSTKAIAKSELTSQPQPIVTGATTALGK